MVFAVFLHPKDCGGSAGPAIAQQKHHCVFDLFLLLPSACLGTTVDRRTNVHDLDCKNSKSSCVLFWRFFAVLCVRAWWHAVLALESVANETHMAVALAPICLAARALKVTLDLGFACMTPRPPHQHNHPNSETNQSSS
jgi:hypothetical protein